MARRSILMLVVASMVACVLSAPAAEKTHESCIAEASEYLGQIEFDDDLRALIQSARENYRNEEAFENPYVRPYIPKSCTVVQDKVDALYSYVPCFADENLMGSDQAQNIVDLAKSGRGARDVIEAFFVCHGGIAAGEMMKNFGLFEAVMSE